MTDGAEFHRFSIRQRGFETANNHRWIQSFWMCSHYGKTLVGLFWVEEAIFIAHYAMWHRQCSIQNCSNEGCCGLCSNRQVSIFLQMVRNDPTKQTAFEMSIKLGFDTRSSNVTTKVVLVIWKTFQKPRNPQFSIHLCICEAITPQRIKIYIMHKTAINSRRNNASI